MNVFHWVGCHFNDCVVSLFVYILPDSTIVDDTGPCEVWTVLSLRLYHWYLWGHLPVFFFFFDWYWFYGFLWDGYSWGSGEPLPTTFDGIFSSLKGVTSRKTSFSSRRVKQIVTRPEDLMSGTKQEEERIMTEIHNLYKRTNNHTLSECYLEFKLSWINRWLGETLERGKNLNLVDPTKFGLCFLVFRFQNRLSLYSLWIPY